MPIPAPNLYPPFNIVRLSHVELGVTDLAASRKFYVDTLGLQVTDEERRRDLSAGAGRARPSLHGAAQVRRQRR